VLVLVVFEDNKELKVIETQARLYWDIDAEIGARRRDSSQEIPKPPSSSSFLAQPATLMAIFLGIGG
jgi:hypothetical protein